MEQERETEELEQEREFKQQMITVIVGDGVSFYIIMRNVTVIIVSTV